MNLLNEGNRVDQLEELKLMEIKPSLHSTFVGSSVDINSTAISCQKIMNQANRLGVFTDKSSKPGGPYSQAVVAGEMVFVSGQLGFEPETGNLVPGGINPETRRTFDNMIAVLEAAGSCLKDVVKVTVLLKDLSDFQAMNLIYKEYFENCDPLPARTTFQAGEMPLNTRIEVDCIAIKRED